MAQTYASCPKCSATTEFECANCGGNNFALEKDGARRVMHAKCHQCKRSVNGFRCSCGCFVVSDHFKGYGPVFASTTKKRV